MGTWHNNAGGIAKLAKAILNWLACWHSRITQLLLVGLTVIIADPYQQGWLDWLSGTPRDRMVGPNHSSTTQ